MNPFKNLNYLYSKNLIEFYDTVGDLASSKPHIFKYASIAWRNLNIENNQTIVVSGVSGSGKTKTISFIVYYYTNILNTNRVKSIENVLINANLILESFGNARTLHNDNSSRFGKYIQLNFFNNKHLSSVKIKTYLLEKTRVLNEIKNERSFHIFSQIIAGTNVQQKTQWEINSDLMGKFSNTPNDSINWQILQTAFNQLRIRNIDQIYKIVIAVAHLNSCEFIYENSTKRFDESDLERVHIILSAKTSDHLENAANLLGFNRGELEKLLLQQELIINSQDDNKRKNVRIVKNCTINEVKTRKDSLAKHFYSNLFTWLVNKINENLNKILSDSTSPLKTIPKTSYIGLLDMYGFENNDNTDNNLEQLCINYANERLHQIYIESFLKFTQNDYLIEEIKWTEVTINDNLDLIKTLDKGSNSLFNLINEESSLKRNHLKKDSTCSSAAYKLSTKIVNRLRNCNHIKHVQKKDDLFLIKHYAGDVYYKIDYNVIEKNNDQIPNDLMIFLRKTKNPFLLELLTQLNPNENRNTVLTKFKKNLDELIDLINQTKVNYIKCIKPNDTSSHSSLFNRSYVLTQLESSGVLSTINLYQLGYTNKYTFQEFIQKYIPTLKHANCRKNSINLKRTREENLDLRNISEKIMKKIAKNKSNSFQLGKTKIFFKDNIAHLLDMILEKVKKEASLKIIKFWKDYKNSKKLTFILTSNSCPALFYHTTTTNRKRGEFKHNYSSEINIEIDFCLSSKCDLNNNNNNNKDEQIQLLHTTDSYKIISKRYCLKNNDRMSLNDCI